MANNLIITGISALLMFYSCTNGKISKDSLPLIDIEANINNMKLVRLSEFTDNIRYIALENVESFPIMGLNKISISGNLILVNSGGLALLYDSEGHFISKIGNKGRGPGEYEVIGHLELVSGINQRIYLSTTFDLIEYDIDGSFLNKISKFFLLNDKYYVQYWSIINDSLIVGNIPNRTGDIEHKAVIINKHGKLIKTYKNYILIKTEGARCFGGQPNIFTFKESIYFKEQFNDTLFLLNDKYDLTPIYKFNLGNLELPLSVRLKFPMGEIFDNYISISNIFQTEDYLLLICDLRNRFPAKRLTSRPSIFPGADPIWTNTTYVLGLYNKRKGNLVFVQPSNTDNPLYASGLYNDIDCGPRFLPKSMVGDNTMLMWISADELKKHVASDDFKNSVPKYPEKKKQLENLADNLSEFDNPVLMFVTFK